MATMFWRDAVPTSRAWSDHECINWDAFHKWARSRSLNMTDPSILVSCFKKSDAKFRATSCNGVLIRNFIESNRPI